MTSWIDLKYVVVDVEGNGQQPPELVELAVVPIVGGVIGETVNWMVRPNRPITAMARRIHGITNEQLVHTDTFADVKASVFEALQADVLVAHNAHVDVGVLHRQLGQWECPEVFDTLKLARRLLPGRPSYKLGALADAFMLGDDLPEELVPHRAEYDALVTARLFVHLVTHTYAEPVSLDELRGGPPQGGGDDETATLF